MSVILKPTVSNIINLWFGVDTPLRQYKIKLNPALWGACQHISRDFRPAAKKRSMEPYRKSDQVAFAIAVQQELERSKPTKTGFADSMVYETATR